MEQITCDIAKRMILNYVDGEVEGLQRAYLRAHIKQCTSCHKRYRILRQSRDMLKESFRPFRPRRDLGDEFADELPKRYPLEGFDPSSVRNLELAGKEGITTPGRQPMSRHRLLLYAAGVFLAVTGLVLLFTFTLLIPVLGKWMGWYEQPTPLHFNYQRQRVVPNPEHSLTNAEDNTVVVFGLGDVGFGAMVGKSRLTYEKHNRGERARWFLLHSGSVYLDCRGRPEWVIFQFGQRSQNYVTPNQVSAQQAQLYFTYKPGPLRADVPGKLTVPVRDGTIRSGQTRTVGAGTRAVMHGLGLIDLEPATLPVVQLNELAPSPNDLSRVDDAVKAGRREILEPLDEILWIVTGRAQEYEPSNTTSTPDVP